jgi:23S rRNA (guanosine2251-2'-O)-methyltransferase
VSSFRERNDRSKPGGKPFSKGAKPAGKTPAPEGARGAQVKPPQAKPAPAKPSPKPPRPERRPDAAAYDPVSERPFRPGQRPRRSEGGTEWLWGWHAVQAALANPNRSGFKRLLATPAKIQEIETAAVRLSLRPEMMEGPDIARLLPSGAVHQGIALLADPLEGEPLADFADDPRGVLLMLDQLTDPQNVGAIFRSAAAFGARGVILQDRHAPILTGALAKAAAGAIDALPHARVVNLSRALEQLAEGGWRVVGLDGSAAETLEQALDGRPTVLVLGSEGEGLRRLVAEHCDTLARIPMPGGFESLNVSNAAAVALYEASRKR